MSERKAYPLSWPEGWKRTAPSARIRAKFINTIRTEFGRRASGAISVSDGTRRVLVELERMGLGSDEILVSTNVALRLDGFPRSDRGEPADPGVAVYWNDPAGKTKCMAIDRYDRVADNLAAIASTLEALRAIERHGGGEILDRAFRGFAALPERAGGKSWRQILKFPELMTPTIEMIRDHFRDIAQIAHPDRSTGSREAFEELMWAREAAIIELTAVRSAGGAG